MHLAAGGSGGGGGGCPRGGGGHAGSGWAPRAEVCRVLLLHNSTAIGASGKGGGLSDDGYYGSVGRALLCARNDDGCTPVHLAAEAGRVGAARVLLRHGGVEAALVRDSRGLTPLHLGRYS